MTQLVRDHALDLVGGLGGIDQPTVQIDRLPRGHEGVDRGVVDENDVDIAGFETGRLDQRRGEFAEEILGFGIAQDRLRRHRLGRQREERAKSKDMGEKAHRDPASGFRPEPELKPASSRRGIRGCLRAGPAGAATGWRAGPARRCGRSPRNSAPRPGRRAVPTLPPARGCCAA